MKRFVLLFFTVFSVLLSKAQDVYQNIDTKENLNIVPHKKILLNALDSAFKHRDAAGYVFNMFTKTDQRLWGYWELVTPFYIAGQYNNNKDFFKPTILGIIDVVPSKKYLIKCAFISRDDSEHNSVQMIFNLLANYDSARQVFKFEKYTNWYIKDWYKIQLPNILFYKQDKKRFSLTEANRLCKFNDSIARIFKVKPKQIVYFSCTDPFQLYNLKGYDYAPNMFYARNGGSTSKGGEDSIYKNIIYSANNKEYYAHELAHFYINEFNTKNTSRIANEGIATFLGGSAEFPLSHHLRILKNYVKKNNLIITDFFEEGSMKMIDSDVSTLYATGGLLAKLIYEKKGIDGWKIFLNIPENKLKDEISKLLGLQNISLANYLEKELEKY